MVEAPSPANNMNGVFVTFVNGVEQEVDDELADRCEREPN